MIAHLTGRVIDHSLHALVLDVAGVGYRIHATTSLLGSATRGSELSCFTHLSVRETALELFGFQSAEELHLFELLIGVSGVGPRGALAILDLAPAETLKQAIAKGDTTYLTKVSGVGKKSAEKIVIELKDKLADMSFTEEHHEGDSEVIDALLSLGYSLSEARSALGRISPETLDTNTRIKEALRALGTH